MYFSLKRISSSHLNSPLLKGINFSSYAEMDNSLLCFFLHKLSHLKFSFCRKLFREWQECFHKPFKRLYSILSLSSICSNYFHKTRSHNSYSIKFCFLTPEPDCEEESILKRPIWRKANSLIIHNIGLSPTFRCLYPFPNASGLISLRTL